MPLRTLSFSEVGSSDGSTKDCIETVGHSHSSSSSISLTVLIGFALNTLLLSLMQEPPELTLARVESTSFALVQLELRRNRSLVQEYRLSGGASRTHAIV